jgi:hypothetical protein
VPTPVMMPAAGGGVAGGGVSVSGRF